MKKTVKWLNKQEAKALGFEPREPERKRTKARYNLDNNKLQELETLKLVRESNTNDYSVSVMSALDENNKMMDIDDYCEYYSLPREDVKKYKLVSHTGVPFYNVLFDDKDGFVDDFDYLGELERQLKGVKKFKYKESKKGKEGVITITDLHFGAYIQGMKITPDFSITILCDMLQYAAKKVNKFGYSKVHVHCLGDLIESFTGLNHKNSWKGLDKGMFGVSAIKLFVELFIKHFLSNIDNLGSIKLVAGNHDRVTSDNNEDVDGGAAELVAWALDLLGYDIEFSTSVITHKVDGINYILNHGHLGLTKLSTQEICWKYGEKGVYNIVMEGHLHSRIAKLSANQVKNFKMVMDDNVDCRRMVCPSLFTGNSYSEYGGWSTCAGFLISESNINKTKVDIYDISI